MTTRPFSTTRRVPTLRDRFGITINRGDRVRVVGYGDGARLLDCGVTSPVVRLGRKRVVIVDADRCERAVAPGNLGVLRRDGVDGYEGNRT